MQHGLQRLTGVGKNQTGESTSISILKIWVEPRTGQDLTHKSQQLYLAAQHHLRSVVEEEDEGDFILADIVQGLERAQAGCCASE